MNVVMKKDGTRGAVMPEEQKKWSNFPIGAAFPPNGAWRGQPQLFKSPFFRGGEKPQAAKREKGYSPPSDRVMF